MDHRSIRGAVNPPYIYTGNERGGAEAAERQPDCLIILRGAMATLEDPLSTERGLPEAQLDEPQMENLAIGVSRHFKPTKETFREPSGC